jgi:hypothetical protein
MLKPPSFTCMICQANHTQVQVCEASLWDGGGKAPDSTVEENNFG